MTKALPAKSLPPAHEKALARALARLKRDSLAAKIGRRTGEPTQKFLARLPSPVAKGLNRGVEKAVLGALDLAVRSLGLETGSKPRPRLASALTGLSGGLSGAVGLAGLPVELPVTTVLMLRSIADIARHMGEDLTTLEARLACVGVFAFGATSGEADVGYFAARAVLGKLAGDASAMMLQRGAVAAAPALNAFAGEVTTRFSAAVWERAAASAAPLIGALGGAALNVIFTNHFNSIAWAHFTIRRLERIYGEEVIREGLARLRAGRRATR